MNIVLPTKALDKDAGLLALRKTGYDTSANDLHRFSEELSTKKKQAIERIGSECGRRDSILP